MVINCSSVSRQMMALRMPCKRPRNGSREADDGRTLCEDEIIDRSSLLSNGVAPKDAQELLGHADVSTTMNIYAYA